jgi:hypothetical protein
MIFDVKSTQMDTSLGMLLQDKPLWERKIPVVGSDESDAELKTMVVKVRKYLEKRQKELKDA